MTPSMNVPMATNMSRTPAEEAKGYPLDGLFDVGFAHHSEFSTGLPRTQEPT
jgi:hypothetical protein